MNVYDILILLAVAGAAVFAALSVRRRKKAGKGCCGNCEGCMLNCQSRQNKP